MEYLRGGIAVDGEFILDGPTANALGIVGNKGGPRWLGWCGGNNWIGAAFIFGGRCNPNKRKIKEQYVQQSTSWFWK